MKFLVNQNESLPQGIGELRREKPSRSRFAERKNPVPSRIRELVTAFSSKRQRKSVLEACENLLTLLESGVGLESACKTLGGTRARSVKAVFSQMTRDAEQGLPMSRTMAAFPHYFDVIDIALVRAGESSGTLNDAIQRMVSRAHLQGRLTSTFVGAIAYPAFLMFFACVVVVFLTHTVLPNLSGMIVAAKGEVPTSTRILMGLGSAIVWGALPLSIGLILFAMLARKASAQMRGWIQSRLLRIPVLGTAYVNWQLAQFCLVLRTLLDSGIFLPEALVLAGNAVADGPVRQAAHGLRDRVLEGHDIGAPPPGIDVGFPDWLWQSLAVGQASGELSHVLLRVGQRFEQSAIRSAARVAAIIEPAMILVIGLLVGLIAYAALMPMIKLGGLW